MDLVNRLGKLNEEIKVRKDEIKHLLNLSSGVDLQKLMNKLPEIKNPSEFSYNKLVKMKSLTKQLEEDFEERDILKSKINIEKINKIQEDIRKALAEQ